MTDYFHLSLKIFAFFINVNRCLKINNISIKHVVHKGVLHRGLHQLVWSVLYN